MAHFKGRLKPATSTAAGLLTVSRTLHQQFMAASLANSTRAAANAAANKTAAAVGTVVIPMLRRPTAVLNRHAAVAASMATTDNATEHKTK